MKSAPADLANVDGVFFLTINSKDRASIATTIERLISILDAMDPDPDLEPWLSGQLGTGDLGDDREEECEDEGAQCDDEGEPDWCIADEDALAPICSIREAVR
ncbi:hypothetical protein ABMA32_14025 [Mesorhizobium sp. VNQ89]|uniref:hypothetical protein n=1 Tax=Mesorhizobium quangtriensis TaxID=3157709 RepID=UPI0032B74A4B